MWEEIREIRLIRAKRLLSNLKHQMNGILWFLSYEKKKQRSGSKGKPTERQDAMQRHESSSKDDDH